MLDNVALNESDDDMTSAETSKPFYIQFARFVSTLLSPAVVSLPFVFLVALHTTESNALFSALITLFFLSIGPMIYIVIGVLRGKFTDVDVSVRSQRTGPFLFGLGSCLLGFLVLVMMHAPKNLQSVLLLTFISGIIMMFITLWWKISMHASSVAAAVTMLSMVYGQIILPAYVLLILVSWSRVVLKRHTTGQVIAGSFMGITLTWLLLTITGLQ